MSRPPYHGKRDQEIQMRFVRVTGFGNATEPKNNDNHKYNLQTRHLDAPEECKRQTMSSRPLSLGSGRYSKFSESSSGNKSLKAGINWTTGISDPCSFMMIIAASVRGLKSGVTIMYLLPVLSIRWAIAEAEFLGEIVKAAASERIIPSSVVAYVIASRRQCIVCQRGRIEKHDGYLFCYQSWPA